MSWWFRLRRLWAQNRIRLSARDLRPLGVEVGDRLEIFGQPWAVAGKTMPAAGPATAPVFILATLCAPRRRATLHPSPRRQGRSTLYYRWLMQDDSGERPVHRRDLVHYAVGSTRHGQLPRGQTPWPAPAEPGLRGGR